MRQRVLLDTGPLVAFLNKRDKYHAWALSQWNEIAPPLLTCEAVLSEACFLLSHLPGGHSPILELLERKIIMPGFQLTDHILPVAKLLKI